MKVWIVFFLGVLLAPSHSFAFTGDCSYVRAGIENPSSSIKLSSIKLSSDQKKVYFTNSQGERKWFTIDVQLRLDFSSSYNRFTNCYWKVRFDPQGLDNNYEPIFSFSSQALSYERVIKELKAYHNYRDDTGYREAVDYYASSLNGDSALMQAQAPLFIDFGKRVKKEVFRYLVVNENGKSISQNRAQIKGSEWWHQGGGESLWQTHRSRFDRKLYVAGRLDYKAALLKSDEGGGLDKTPLWVDQSCCSPSAIAEFEDGDFLILLDSREGPQYSLISGVNSSLVRVQRDGTEVWRKPLKQDRTEDDVVVFASSVWINSEGVIKVAGRRDKFSNVFSNNQSSNLGIFDFDPSSGFQTQYQELNVKVWIPGGNLVTASGDVFHFGVSKTQEYVLLMDENGKIKWLRWLNLGWDNRRTHAVETPEGDFILAGESTVIKISKQRGQILWKNDLGWGTQLNRVIRAGSGAGASYLAIGSTIPFRNPIPWREEYYRYGTRLSSPIVFHLDGSGRILSTDVLSGARIETQDKPQFHEATLLGGLWLGGNLFRLVGLARNTFLISEDPAYPDFGGSAGFMTDFRTE